MLAKKWGNFTFSSEQREGIISEGFFADFFPAYVIKQVDAFLEERRVTGYGVYGEAGNVADDVEDFLRHWYNSQPKKKGGQPKNKNAASTHRKDLISVTLRLEKNVLEDIKNLAGDEGYNELVRVMLDEAIQRRI